MKYLVFTRCSEVPKEYWDATPLNNLFFSLSYCQALEKSMPKGAQIFYVFARDKHKVIGTLIAHLFNIQHNRSFGNRDSKLINFSRKIILRSFAKNVLFIGNPYLTGEYDALINSPEIDKESFVKMAVEALKIHLKTNNTKISFIAYKDYPEAWINPPKNSVNFSGQPDMYISVDSSWMTKDDYINQLKKKYRDQYKRSLNKGKTILSKNLDVQELKNSESILHNLYLNVVNKAGFNSFILPSTHWFELKKSLPNTFFVIGFYEKDSLIGFCSYFVEKDKFITYFLGYDTNTQKESMLYMNMLYYMLFESIHLRCKTIELSRTAMEIKSSIGAQPRIMHSYLLHTNPFINRFVKVFINFLNPKIEWTQRHPFK